MSSLWVNYQNLKFNEEAFDAFNIWWFDNGGRLDDIKEPDERIAIAYIAFCKGFESCSNKSEKKMNNKAVVIYSGGMDSRTVLQKAIEENDTVFALSFDYGQRHVKELVFAEEVCNELGILHKVLDMTFMRDIASNSALTSDAIAVPEGHYEAENMKATIVPNRNMIMLSLAYGYAINIGANRVYYGAHGGDHHIYPDCRPEFVAGMKLMGHLVDENKLELIVPYLNANKASILMDGFRLGVDYGKTWTCYKGEEKPCGVCGACQERAEAFATVGVSDPLLTSGE